MTSWQSSSLKQWAACPLILIALAGCGHETMPQGKSGDGGTASTVVPPKQELGQLKYQRDKVLQAMSRLEEERQAVLGRIQRLKGQSIKQTGTHPDWRIYAQELKDVVQKIQRLDVTASAYDRAIARMEVVLRRDDRNARMEGIGLTEAQLDELSRITHQLNEDLRSPAAVPEFEDLELEDLIQRELSRDTKTGAYDD